MSVSTFSAFKWNSRFRFDPDVELNTVSRSLASFKRRLLTSVRKRSVRTRRKISEYKKEIDRNRKLLDLVPNSDLKRRGSVCPADVQQVLETKKGFSERLGVESNWTLDPEPPT
ncbi:zinc finger protein OZF-like isoform X3 [Lates japonicus]|uniref:Zinc finger protein OZF-like isoform X3 n=1 Tax=Lates japonicus TaxID=270547 RepID=A0AAD3R8H4_LATJO|nr:zinc finger protein OZF-like isoform X3 [Lates japonicus]